jgi:hypothetical protein
MTAFDEIQQLWNQQSLPVTTPQPEAVIKAAQKKMRTIRANHLFTMGILTVTVVALTAYFFAYTNFTFNRFFTGLLFMAGSLLLRVGLEYASYRRFNKIDVHADFTAYTNGITQFYKGREKIHFYLTPLVLVLYFVGFAILLPIFKETFSAGFYLYIVISGTLFCCLFIWFIVRHAKKEMRLLDFLKGIKASNSAD